ncbi:MAG TPA: FAD-dependent oxidoreductase [Vicinamibacterales bacterium]|nr:FAD-dependent oxidoreductase [Vicinamibacterales bacterium]
MASRSYWTDSASLPAFAPLDRDKRADVVVVGGGITGLTTAYLLTRAGRSVVLLERGRCAQIDTGHTTAHLTMVTDTRLTELVSRFGRTHAQAAWDAGRAAIAQIDDIACEHEIDCAFKWVEGYLHARDRRAGAGEAEPFREDAALACELGFDATFMTTVPFAGGPGIRFHDQARVHPRRYLAGVARALTNAGGEIFEHSEAAEFRDSPLGVKANGHWVSCQDIVLATHNPLVGIASMASATVFQTKLALYTSYVVAGRIPRGTVPDALFWDTGDPYRYVRLEAHRDHDLLIVGGEDHKTGQTADTGECFERLEQVARERVPDIELTHRWSGQVIETPDGLPYIGSMTDHQYAATGFGGNGMTFGTLGGMLIADAIAGRENPWKDLFEPGRSALRRGLWEYVKENADYPYYMLRDRFSGAEGRSIRSVKRRQGQVIEHNGEKVAAYRDSHGALTLRSAVCTHMGCVVGWNDAEGTWDCPCHGSRFTPQGDVIAGPAETPLPEATKKQAAPVKRN